MNVIRRKWQGLPRGVVVELSFEFGAPVRVGDRLRAEVKDGVDLELVDGAGDDGEVFQLVKFRTMASGDGDDAAARDPANAATWAALKELLGAWRAWEEQLAWG